MRHWLARHRRAADEVTEEVTDEVVADEVPEPRREVPPRRRYSSEMHLPREDRPRRAPRRDRG